MLREVFYVCFLFFIWVLVSVADREIYIEIFDKNISHCSRKLNINSQVGCSSKYPSSIGEVILSYNATHLRNCIENSSSSLMVVIPLELFIDRNITSFLRSSNNVAGLFVFSPKFPNTPLYSPLAFSENTYCPSGNFTFYKETNKLCDVNPEWNPSASEYATLSWPFPVVLAQENDTDTWDKIFICYDTYNRSPIDDTRCLMEIRNYMSAVQSSETCYRRELLQSYHFEQSNSLCSQIGGVNLMLRARNTTTAEEIGINSTEPDPTIFVISRVDAMSMFDRRATSALSVLPAVSVMISAAVHLLNTPSIKAGRIRKNLVFLFLDNEALSFMGSQRFLFDLAHGRVGQASGLPLTTHSIESVIELVGLGLPQEDGNKTPTYYLISDPTVPNITEKTHSIWRALNTSAAATSGKIRFLNGSTVDSTTLLPPSASTQALLKYFLRSGLTLSHTIISDRPAAPPLADTFVDSFLDVHWPPTSAADEHLLHLANVLADALHREITEASLPISRSINGIKPADLMYCFLHNPGCDLLRMHLEPEVVDFLLSLNGPIPMQTYEPVDGHNWRVSHVVSRVLMGLTGERLKECPTSENYGAFTYMYGYYNGSTWCYRSLVETATSFFFLENGEVAAPGWVRSVPFENLRFVRLFRSASPSNDKLALAIGCALTIITGIVAILGRIFSDRLFIRPYHEPWPRHC